MAYQSILSGQTPTPSGSSNYKSILPPASHTQAIKSSFLAEKPQLQKQLYKGSVSLKQQLAQGKINQQQFLQRFAQQNKEPANVAQDTTGGFSPKNLGHAVATTAREVAQFPVRAAAELGTSTGLTDKRSFNKVGRFLGGSQPVTPLQQQGEETAATHPKGFHIKGTPITLTPTETGVGLAAGKGLMDILAVKGGAKAPIKAADKFNARTTAAKTTLQNATVSNVLKNVSQDTKTPSPAPPKFSETVAKPSPTPVETQIKPAGQGSTKPKLNLGEEGSVAPGQAASDVKSMLQKHQESTKFSGELEHNATQVEGAKKVIQQDSAKLIKNRQPLTNADKQTLQNYRDAKAAGLTPKALPEHLIAEDKATTELNKAAQAHDAELARLNGQEAKVQSIEARNPETYTHREAMNKGSALDYVAQGSRKNPLSVGGLSKTTPASKARVFHAITDEQGNRRVVAIKNSVLRDEQGRKIAQGKLVQAIDNGKNENLGKLKLNTNQDFLDKELKPYQAKVRSLQKEGDALSKVKTKGGVSEARITALAQKVSLLEDPGNMTTLTRSEAKSLRDAKLKLRELTSVKPTKTNAEGRLKTINYHLIKMNKGIADIHDKYDPENMDKKIFVGKDGKKYTIGQATTSEITKATGQKYYTDPKLMALKNYAESRTALENARFIESFKQHPDFEKFASAPGQTAPKGWQGVKGLDQFRGYKFEPKTAEVLRDIVKNSGGDEKKLFDEAGNFLKQTIVYFPLKHTLNEYATYRVDKGLSRILPNPVAITRGAKSLIQAFHEVTNQGPIFQAAQKAGLHTVTGGDKALQDAFAKEIKNLSGDERLLSDVAKQWGSTPKRVYNAIQNITVWQLQDILNMSRVIERTKPTLFGKGLSIDNAVAKTQKYNLQYSVPSRVGPRILPGKVQRGVANTLSSPKVFFGRYRYDLFRILTNSIKDSINLKSLAKNPKDNIQALDKLAAMAVGAWIVWPYVDKGIQAVSHIPTAYMKGPGTLELPSETKDVAQGKKKASGVISNQLFVSSAVTVPLDIKANRDSFTGKQIYDPNASSKDQLKAILSWSKGQIAPAQQYKQVKDAGGNKVVDTLLTLASARFPKNSPETNNLNSLKYDSLPNIQASAKALAAQGNINGAIDAIKSYDKQVLQATKTALKSAGQPVPDDKTLIAKLKDQQYYYNPTRATVQGWASPSAKTGTLDNILNSNPTPKKGQPGYLQYRIQQKQKTLLNRFKNPADKQTVLP